MKGFRTIFVDGITYNWKLSKDKLFVVFNYIDRISNTKINFSGYYSEIATRKEYYSGEGDTTYMAFTVTPEDVDTFIKNRGS